ncbi:hypothetical protein ACH5RR_009281 [Cinchona calisaya]|uniref:Uncharacterized protein n=1 Tax=Cinchona calisaya TaxID=153742 RepID=A0ABD3AE71_9GENT
MTDWAFKAPGWKIGMLDNNEQGCGTKHGDMIHNCLVPNQFGLFLRVSILNPAIKRSLSLKPKFTDRGGCKDPVADDTNFGSSEQSGSIEQSVQNFDKILVTRAVSGRGSILKMTIVGVREDGCIKPILSSSASLASFDNLCEIPVQKSSFVMGPLNTQQHVGVTSTSNVNPIVNSIPSEYDQSDYRIHVE